MRGALCSPGRGEAENRACEGLGFAEVFGFEEVRGEAADFDEMHRKWTKMGRNWPILGHFDPKTGQNHRFSALFGFENEFSFPARKFLFRLRNFFFDQNWSEK